MSAFDGVMLAGGGARRLSDVAAEVEQLGYGTAWCAEVMGPDAITVLTAAAMKTSHITLATGIVPTFVRDPYLMAMTLSSLQELSGGRVIGGFGTSTPNIVTGWHSLPFEKPLATTREYVRIVRQFLAGERVKTDGIYTIRGATIARPADPPVPIYLGALNPGMLELAGEIADGVIINFPTLSNVRASIETVERGLAKAGRKREEIRVVINLRAGITDGFDDIAAPLRRELVTYALTPVYQRLFTADGYGHEIEDAVRLWGAGDRPGAIAAMSDRLVDAHAVIGTVEACKAKAEEFVRTAGGDYAVLFPVVADGPGGLDRQVETIRAFAPNAA